MTELPCLKHVQLFSYQSTSTATAEILFLRHENETPDFQAKLQTQKLSRLRPTLVPAELLPSSRLHAGEAIGLLRERCFHHPVEDIACPAPPAREVQLERDAVVRRSALRAALLDC